MHERISDSGPRAGGSFLLLLIDIPVRGYTSPCSLPAEEHLGCSQPLVVINNATVHARTDFCVNRHFSFSWLVPRSGVAGLHSKWMLNFIRNCQVVSNVMVAVSYVSALGIVKYFKN